jgi:hypothetical protein
MDKRCDLWTQFANHGIKIREVELILILAEDPAEIMVIACPVNC